MSLRVRGKHGSRVSPELEREYRSTASPSTLSHSTELSSPSFSTSDSWSPVSSQGTEYDGTPSRVASSGVQIPSHILERRDAFANSAYDNSRDAQSLNYQYSRGNQQRYEQQPFASSAFPALQGGFQSAPTRLTNGVPLENQAAWEDAHFRARPGENITWESFLSPAWPQQEIYHITDGCTWYTACSGCHHPTTPIYHRPESWLLHVWMEHPDWASWVPTYCSSECHDQTTVYETMESWLAHMWDDHQDWGHWIQRCCFWPNCSSPPSQYKAAKLCMNHVHSVHLKDFWCDKPGCSRARGGSDETPFGSKNVLERHILTHLPPQYCLSPHCAGRRNSDLRRHDKNVTHQRKWHGPFHCSKEGCKRRRIGGFDHGFESRAQRDEHERDHLRRS
jgi:hypothetical protein